MKCFIPLDEDAILKLWVKNPKLVAPYSKPFYPSMYASKDLNTEVSDLLSKKKPLHTEDDHS